MSENEQEAVPMVFEFWPKPAAEQPEDEDIVATQVVVRQVGFGITPFIMIKPDWDDEQDLAGFHIDLSEISLEEAQSVLHMVKAAIDQHLGGEHPELSKREDT